MSVFPANAWNISDNATSDRMVRGRATKAGTDSLEQHMSGTDCRESSDPRKPEGAGPGAKDDSGKARHDLIPTALLDAVARVLTYGAFERPRADGSRGYGTHNWQGVPDAKARYYAAAQRHLVAYRKDPTSKDDSGCSHLAHAATNLAFLLAFEHGFDPVL